jgi:hypothetical protein
VPSCGFHLDFPFIPNHSHPFPVIPGMQEKERTGYEYFIRSIHAHAIFFRGMDEMGMDY